MWCGYGVIEGQGVVSIVDPGCGDLVRELSGCSVEEQGEVPGLGLYGFMTIQIWRVT